MNLYFLSLLDPGRTRQKTLAATHCFGWKWNPQTGNHYYTNYHVLNRFPMIEKGDIICPFERTSLNSSIWDGMGFIYMDDVSRTKPVVSHQFSPYHWSDAYNSFLFSDQIKNRLKKLIKHKKWKNQFRIGKHKWTLKKCRKIKMNKSFLNCEFRVVDWKEKVIETWQIY
jgi:hypothetical protein